MGKQGPCRHCGTTSTPLWRNGPPRKPVLCNACGSRWRLKGTLVNYKPLHARTLHPLDSEDVLNSQKNKLPFKIKAKNLHIAVDSEGDKEEGEIFAGYDLGPMGFKSDTSNRSSSGSAISCSESCMQLRSKDGIAVSGSVQSSFWDFPIPSRKRSRTRGCILSTVEKLRRDLINIIQEQGLSYPSGSPEEVLIFKREDLLSSAEIGLGSVCLKPPVPFTEEKSESQSSEISSSQGGIYRVIRDIGDTEELRENPAKQSALTNKYLGNSLLGDPDVLQSKDSPQIHINPKTLNNESFETQNDISYSSTHLIECGISLPAKTHPVQPYLQTNEGTSSDTIRAIKKPKVRSLMECGISLPANKHPVPPYFQKHGGTSSNAIRAFKKPKERNLIECGISLPAKRDSIPPNFPTYNFSSLDFVTQLVSSFQKARPKKGSEGQIIVTQLHIECPGTNSDTIRDFKKPKEQNLNECVISLPTKRHPVSLDFQTYGGTSSDTIRDFKKPMERKLIECGISLPSKRDPVLPDVQTYGGTSLDTSRDFKKPKEYSLIECGISLLAKRDPVPPDFQTYGGSSSDTIRTLRKPKERAVIQNPSSNEAETDAGTFQYSDISVLTEQLNSGTFH